MPIKKPEILIPLIWTALCLSSASLDLKNVDQLFPLFSWQLFADYPQAYERSYVFTSPSELIFTKRYDIPLSRKDKKRIWKLGNKIGIEKAPEQKNKLVKQTCGVLKGRDFQVETVLFISSELYSENLVSKKVRSESFDCS